MSIVDNYSGIAAKLKEMQKPAIIDIVYKSNAKFTNTLFKIMYDNLWINSQLTRYEWYETPKGRSQLIWKLEDDELVFYRPAGREWFRASRHNEAVT